MRTLATTIFAALLAAQATFVGATSDPVKQAISAEGTQIAALDGQKIRDLFTFRKKAKPLQIERSRSWVDAQPAVTGDEQWACLAQALYFEARGESVRGQFAVAEVILNRVDSAQFPNTLCKVIHQGTGRKYACQFTYTCDGNPEVIHEKAAYQRAALARSSRAGLGGLPAAADRRAAADRPHAHREPVRRERAPP